MKKPICTIQTIEDIVQILDRTGMTYQEIADHVKRKGGKISAATVCNWFNRKVNMPNLNKLLEVTNAFGFQIRVFEAGRS